MITKSALYIEASCFYLIFKEIVVTDIILNLFVLNLTQIFLYISGILHIQICGQRYLCLDSNPKNVTFHLHPTHLWENPSIVVSHILPLELVKTTHLLLPYKKDT